MSPLVSQMIMNDTSVDDTLVMVGIAHLLEQRTQNPRAGIAQLVEQRTENPRVTSSNLVSGIGFINFDKFRFF